MIEEKKDEMEMTAIAKSLAEINEQLAIRNRRSSRLLKVICGIVIGFFLFIVIMVALNIFVGSPVIENDEIVVYVENRAVEESDLPIELDKNSVPQFSQINNETEHVLREFFGSENLTEELLVRSWGKPEMEDEGKMSWLLDDEKVFTVFFNDAHCAYDCGIETK